ncbi:MAG: hypothetical protein HKM93_14045 [Desulfobacteraceae bacterium]|nr:hypothetical protein [Desulfobacteraceae bacterium]
MNSNSIRINPKYLLVLLLILNLYGCAVLSKSQVREVERFTKASEQYTSLPGALAESYGVLLRNNKLLAISNKSFGKTGEDGSMDTGEAIKVWEEIGHAYELETGFNKIGKQLDAALSVLTAYSQVLTALISEEFGDDLSDSTEKLGKSLDKATDEYNEIFTHREPIEKKGGLIAKTARSAGGIYLRHKQVSILRDTVEAADPLVHKLMADVEGIVTTALKPALLNYEKNFLGREFRSVANHYKKLSVCTIAFVYEDLKRTRDTIILADHVIAAARIYKKAHRKLVENTRTRKDLKYAIEEINTLKDEVDKARKVGKSVNK